MKRVAIVGLGLTPARIRTPELSYKELTYQAAKAAYADAGITPAEVQAFITCAEDLNEGTSIFDEYTPDQLGAVHKPMHTVTHDGLVGLANAFMLVQTGFDLIVVEAHSKASNVLTKDEILSYAMDPVWQRPLGLNPHAIAGLEMDAFLAASGNTAEQAAAVVVKNRSYARKNPNAAFGKTIALGSVLRSRPVFTPLKEAEVASHADGAVVFVVASQEKADELEGKAVWISGVGWATATPSLESRDWTQAVYAQEAARRAYAMAGVKDPPKELDLIEADDTYAYKELQHLEAIGYFDKGQSGKAVLDSLQAKDGLPVNLSGGVLGVGETYEAKGLYQAAELVLQLRGQAGKRQRQARRALALSWRGVPTASGAAVVFSAN